MSDESSARDDVPRPEPKSAGEQTTQAQVLAVLLVAATAARRTVVQTGRFYVLHRLALRRYASQFFPALLPGSAITHEIVISEDEEWHSAERDGDSWTVELPPLCVSCGEPVDSPLIEETRKATGMAIPAWMPLVGVISIPIMGWSVTDQVQWLIVPGLLLGFLGGYWMRQTTAVHLQFARCRKHEEQSRFPEVYRFGGQLFLRIGSKLVRREFENIERGAIPEPTLIPTIATVADTAAPPSRDSCLHSADNEFTSPALEVSPTFEHEQTTVLSGDFGKDIIITLEQCSDGKIKVGTENGQVSWHRKTNPEPGDYGLFTFRHDHVRPPLITDKSIAEFVLAIVALGVAYWVNHSGIAARSVSPEVVWGCAGGAVLYSLGAIFRPLAKHIRTCATQGKYSVSLLILKESEPDNGLLLYRGAGEGAVPIMVEVAKHVTEFTHCAVYVPPTE